MTVSFELRLRLGTGGMGEVHLARMITGAGAELVALKRIRSEMSEQPDLRLQFEREARITSLLRHPHIVELRRFGIDDKGPFLALEFIEGRSALGLEIALHDRGLSMPLQVALAICRDAARGLVFAHSFRNQAEGVDHVVHRDISPDNFLVGYDGFTKVSDFGIAKIVGGTTLSHTDTVRGKYGYMAPELFEGDEADTRSDVFAFAATLFRLVTGTPAFQGKTEAEMLRAVLHSQPVRASQLVEVPAAIDEWIDRALGKIPRDRPANLTEILALLEAALAREPDEGRAAVSEQMRTCFPIGDDQRRADIFAAMNAATRVDAPKGRPPQARGVRLWPLLLAGGLSAGLGVVYAVWELTSVPERVPQETKVATLTPAMARPPVVEPEPESQPSPAVVDAGAVAEIARPAAAPLPTVVYYPLAGFTLDARQHAFVVPSPRVVKLALNPKKSYRVWTEDRVSLGGALESMVTDCVYFLQGELPARDSFGMVGPKGVVVKGATMLHAFISDDSPSDDSGALKLRVMDLGARTTSTLLIDATKHTLVPAPSGRVKVEGLEALASYELRLKDGAVPAQTRGKKRGPVRRVLVSQAPGLSAALEGRSLANEVSRILEVGKPLRVSGTPWVWLSIPDDALEDNAGTLEVELTVMPTGSWLSPQRRK